MKWEKIIIRLRFVEFQTPVEEKKEAILKTSSSESEIK